MNTNSLLLDVLSIPEHMGGYVAVTRAIAFGLMPFLFTLGVLREQAKIVAGSDPKYFPLIFNVFGIS